MDLRVLRRRARPAHPRLEWTLNSDRVWTATHRFAGPCFVAAGLAVLASCALPPTGMIVVLLVAVLGACLIAPLVFAKLAWDADVRTR
ncbi:MAG: SdpI family protein [Armatimonadetes bacterium]|nr:SdpI family protein [Armatimonadota bacterium]